MCISIHKNDKKSQVEQVEYVIVRLDFNLNNKTSPQTLASLSVGARYHEKRKERETKKRFTNKCFALQENYNKTAF